MAVYKAPGVYVEEVPSRGSAITGLVAGIMAMQGVCEKGPEDEPTRINNWTEFEKVFGSYFSGGDLAYVYRNFLDNGGGSCYIRRPARTGAAKSTGDIDNAAAAAAITIEAKSKGTWGDRIKVTVEKDPQGDTILASGYTAASGDTQIEVDSVVGFKVGEWIQVAEGVNAEYRLIESIDSETGIITWSSGDGALTNDYTVAATVKSQEFKLTVYETIDGVDYEREIWENLSVVSTLNNFYEAVVNDSAFPAALGSDWITLDDQDLEDEARIPDDTAQTVSLTSGADGSADATGDADFSSFDAIIDQITALAAPLSAVAIQTAGIAYAMSKNCVFLCDTPASTVKAGAITYRNETLGSTRSQAALYWPNFVVVDPIGVGNNPEKQISCLGAVMGQTAYIQNKYGAWRSPAGLIASVVGIKRLYVTPTMEDQEELNPIGVNVIRPVQNINRIYGARTLESPAGDYKYLGVRYGFSYIEKSIQQNTGWVIFEANDKPLWDRIKASVSAFLTSLGQAGAFEGTTPKDWYFVKCDSDLNTEAQKATGYVLCQIGLALVRPAEFLVFTFSKYTKS